MSLEVKCINPGKFLLLDMESKQSYATFYTKYQDIVNSKGDTVATEVLSRVRLNTGNDLCSEMFFKVIDDNVIKDLVLNQIKGTYGQYGHHPNVGSGRLYAFNVSASCLEDSTFVNTLLALDCPSFALEVNNTPNFYLSECAINNAKTLRQVGHEIWFDDCFVFNELCQNLSMPNSMMWDVVKIDKSFLLLDECYPGELVALVNKLLENYKCVVVEGIEHLSQASLFRSNNRVLLQGYYFSSCLYYSDWFQLN
ncbi:EAL domain-containing protein [Vibrio barjaei]|uniref:EAL domain-containing protein n=1 Tax=Vibrio barjaei TaxID=1676683 RepID=UPI002284EDA6|nr:EAL domain-containing protein [Vibrio barjaei]MCY9873914.1 EAL domain-containing protein [Vibrio barjaei]